MSTTYQVFKYEDIRISHRRRLFTSVKLDCHQWCSQLGFTDGGKLLQNYSHVNIR